MPAKSSTKAITPSSQLRETDPSSGNRKRRAEDDDFDASKSQIYDEHGKTRRINPFKLATRLHPDLVKEMEAYIKPGAIMPNFEIRKELQLRYQVDRRHLYDYFHSRGLRVGKEDRHSNLTRSRMAKAKALAQTEVVKENSTLKPVKRIKITPVKRSTAKPATKKAIKKSTRETTVDNHAPEAHDSDRDGEYDTDVEYVSRIETKCDTGDCPSASSDMNIDAAVESQPSFQKDFILSTCGDFFQSPPRRFHAVSDVSTAAALAEIPSPLLENFILSGRSTPSLIDDTSSSSCKSPSPAYVQPLEEEEGPFCPSEFLNLPEEPFMDTALDRSFTHAPSMIGNLLSSPERKNMYNHIDTSIVSNGSSFALNVDRVFPAAVDKSFFDSLFPSVRVPSFDSSSSFDAYLDAVVHGSPSQSNGVPSRLVPQQSQLLPSSSSSGSTSSSFQCLSPSAFSNNVPRQFTPGDLLTLASGPGPVGPVDTRLNYDYGVGRRFAQASTSTCMSTVSAPAQSSAYAAYARTNYLSYAVPSALQSRVGSVSMEGSF